MKRVLLTNAQQRKTLAVARSLGEKGVAIYACETTRFTPTTFSKYCKKGLVCPDPKKYPDEFYKWIVKIIKEYKIDILIPMDDDTIEIAIANREFLESICLVPLPPSDSYKIASDKGSSVELAEKAGVPCPKTLFVEDISQLEKISTEINYPIVIKPRKSSGSRGIRIVLKQADFVGTYMEIHNKYNLPLVQEYIELGPRVDVCLLFNKEGQIRASFVQKELRHFPIETGPSTVQKSIFDEHLLKQAVEIMNGIKWFGIAEIEFMQDKKDGIYKFMEINTRFWASLQLAIISGVDFAKLLYDILDLGDCELKAEYKEGIICRWLLPADILHYITNKKRAEMNPPFFSGAKDGVNDDIISKNDPLPVLGFLLACFRYVFDIETWKFVFKR